MLSLPPTDDIDALRQWAINEIGRRDALLAEQTKSIDQRDALVAAQARSIDQRDVALRRRDQLIDSLKAHIQTLQRAKFGAKAERFDAEQRTLFDEAIDTEIAEALAQVEQVEDTTTPATRRRPSPPRRTLPADLPRIETRHEPAVCTCTDCGGALSLIGEQVSEKLDIKPAEFFVRRDIYPQYTCRACETITAAPVPAAIIDRGLAAPGLLADVVINKYTDHLPLYRLEPRYARAGIELKRGMLAEWVGRVGLALQPLVDALRKQLLSEDILHADETPLQVLDPGKGQTKRAYLFAYRSTGEQPVVVFEYCSSRSGSNAERFLGDWQGALMVDDFAGYKKLFPAITELGCWAHARRKFYEQHAASHSTIAEEALARIAALYAIEAEARALTPEARHALRQHKARPLLDSMKRWLDATRAGSLGNTGTLRAIDYTLKRWNALTRHLDDGRRPIDNNPIENAIRPIAVGRKNWLFAGSDSAAKRAAAIMSLLATAKANGHDQHAWLTDVLARLPTTLDRDIEALLPHRWKPAT